MNERGHLSYTEDTLVQQTTADYLEKELGWKSVYYNTGTFDPDEHRRIY